MFKLRYGYLISGILIGCILLVNFISSLPDGKLHIFFCNVGQGDAAYIRFPDGRDMLVDGGPDDSVLLCLGRHMPFWDREINIIVNTHPQSDHLKGLVSVLNRYKVDYVVRSDLTDPSDVYAQFIDAIKVHHVPVHFETAGARITIGAVMLSFVWPSSYQIALMKLAPNTDLNNGCLVFFLRYGSFDALFTGDAPMNQALGQAQVLKVPHHGSKTGMTQDFVDWVRPRISIISVGKNSFGQPAPEIIAMLQSVGSKIFRTDKSGDIEVISDGQTWRISSPNVPPASS